VRLYQGDPGRETVYGENPVEVARQWEQLGAKMLHLVDLDGAFTGLTQNARIISAIGEEVQIPLQLGGGMRTKENVEKAFSAGICRIILGTLAVESPDLAREMVKEYGAGILIGIDARDGNVAVKGWTESSSLDVNDFAVQVEQWGVKEIVYTDISRDGTLSGPNLKGLESLLNRTKLQVIMSGGISSLDDLIALKPYKDRVRGVIVGKALYSNQFSLSDAMSAIN
jgi:phosphoribosylformimino-5-aminoimidazole carboxamide ribotide isomerase